MVAVKTKIPAEKLAMVQNALDNGVKSVNAISKASGVSRKSVAALLERAAKEPEPLTMVEKLTEIHRKRDGESLSDWLERTEKERIALDPTPMKKFVPSGNGDPDSQQEWESFKEYCERRDRERRGL